MTWSIKIPPRWYARWVQAVSVTLALALVAVSVQAVDTDLARLVFQLRPTGLEDCGLAEGVAVHAEPWSQLSGVPVDLLARVAGTVRYQANRKVHIDPAPAEGSVA